MTLKALVEEWYSQDSETELTDQQNWLGWDAWVCFDDIRHCGIKRNTEK